MNHKIICHRGIDRIDENTYKSITSVISLYNTKTVTFGVEFDIQITKDNNIICYHDDTLLRLHGCDKRVCDITIDEIEKYNLPYFNDVMAKLSLNKNVIVDVEIKFYQPMHIDKIKLLCKKSINICKINNALDQCIFTSFDDNIIHELVFVDKFIKIGKIIGNDYNLLDFVQLKKLQINILILDKNMLIETLNEHADLLNNVELYIYTLFNIKSNEESDIQLDIEIINKIKNKNIGLITDDYQKTLQFIK